MNGLRIQVPRYGAGVVGLPDRAVVLTNSERSRAACPARWLFAVADRLQPQVKARPLAWGTAWHAVLEDVHRWWMVHDTEYPWLDGGLGCAWCQGAGSVQGLVWQGGEAYPRDRQRCGHCDGTGAGPVARSRAAWLQEANTDEGYTHDEADKDAETLRRAAEGWLQVYGAAPPTDYRVVGVELRLAVPVPTPSGGTYSPHTWIVPDGPGWRLAGTGEAHHLGAKRVRWPWYQCLTLDALFQHRKTGGLYVGEHKSAKAPGRRVQAVIVDPQLAGYVWATGEAVARGLVPGVDSATPVHGYVYDVASNQYQADPQLLAPKKVHATDAQGRPLYHQPKGAGGGTGLAETSRKVWLTDASGDPVLRSPGLSQNPRAGVPTWRYRAALQAHGFDPAGYADHMLNLSAVDAKLYQRITGTSGAEVGARYARELYAVARQLAAWRRRAATLTSQAERDLYFPRQPVCMFGGGCAWRAPCLQDGELVRRDFDLADTQRWVPDAATAATGGEEDLGW